MSQTFNETTVNFDGEVKRLQDRIDDLQEQLAELDADAPQREQVTSTIQTLESHRKGVVWARDQAYESDDFPQWDEDADGITLGALRAGAYAGLRDDMEADPDAGGGTTGNLVVAEGTVEAPYIDDGMTDTERIGAVSQLHPFFRDWAEARITTLMDPEADLSDTEGNGTPSDGSLEKTPETTT